MRTQGCLAAAASALLGTAPAHAVEKVLLEAPVKYADDAHVVEPVRRQCDLEKKLEEHITKLLVKRDQISDVTIAKDADAHGVPVLRVQISFVLGVGGGAWSGPKGMTVYAQLLDGKTVKSEKRFSRSTIGGVWGGFKGTCSILDRASIRVAKDVVKFGFGEAVDGAEEEAEGASSAASPSSR